MIKQKRGQFYLIATIIIITAIAGFAIVSNYAKKRAPAKLFDLKEELGIEISSVLDYGTYQQEDLHALLEQFIRDYVDYAGEGRNLYFIYGNTHQVTAIAYQDLSSEEASIIVGGENRILVSGESQIFLSPTGNKITIIIDLEEYTFMLRTGENFYFVITQEVEGEKYVITN